jgi:hypothetical protein
VLLKQIEGRSGLVRDEKNVIHNINKSDIELQRARKLKNLATGQEMKQIKDDVSNLKNDILDIKKLLNQILERV